jgi:hypothetical protein
MPASRIIRIASNPAMECHGVVLRVLGLLHERDHRAVRRERDAAHADDAVIGQHSDGADAERQRFADDLREVRSDGRAQPDDRTRVDGNVFARRGHPSNLPPRHPLSLVVIPVTTPPTVHGAGACASRHSRASVFHSPGTSIMGSSYSLHTVPHGVG